MSENQYLEIIENKIDDITKMVEQQSKSGVFFDGFTKQVLEKIHNQLEYISNFESNELITYLSEEMKGTLDERDTLLKQRLDDVKTDIEKIKSGLSESIKTPEILQIFSKLSDSVNDFSHDLNSQTKYFNTTIESIQQEISKVRLDGRLEEQAAGIKSEINTYKASLNNLGADINSGFASLKRVIEDNGQNESLVALSGDISVVQNGLNDVINAVLTMNSKQGEMLATVSNISTNVDTSDIRADVSSMLVEIQALKDLFRALANKADIEALNEKINYAIETISNIKELTSFNDKENKTVFKQYFNDLNDLLSSLVSKEEGEFIKNKLDFIQAAVESGRQDVREVLQNNSEELKNLIPFISSLSTKENVQELSENAINSLSALAEQWNQSIAQYANATENKLETFRRTLSNIHDTLETISSKVETGGVQGGVGIKEAVDNILNSVNEMSERLASSAQSSIMDLSKNFADLSNLIIVKTNSLEQIVNASQDGLKSDLSGNIEQLKEFTQSLVSAISVFNNKIDSKADEIKSVLIDRYDELYKKVNDLSATYATSSFEQKTQLADGINMLKAAVEAVKSGTVDGSMVDEINNKINQVSELLQLTQNSLAESGEKLANTVSIQNNLSENINNGIKDLYSKISELNSAAASNKEEIVNDLANKIYSVASQIEDLKGQIFNNLEGSRDKIQEEFLNLKSSTDEVKNLLGELNQNQTGNEVLSQLLENVNEKLESVSNLIASNKDYSLEQYAVIKQLTGDLKTEISEVIIHLNQSSDFAKNLMDRMSAGFVESAESLLQQTAILKNDILNTASENKSELSQKIETVEEALKNVQNSVSNLNFDESVKEQLAALKQQMETFNQQSLVDFLNKVSENNEQFGSNIAETLNNVKYRFDELFNNIGVIQAQQKAVQEAFAQGLTDNLNEINQAINLFGEKIKLFVFDNKEQVLREIDVLKNSTNDLQYGIDSISEKLPQTDDLISRLDELYQNINNIVDAIQVSGLEDKEQILREISDLKSFAGEVQDKLNFIAGSQLNQDFINARTEKIDDAIKAFADNIQQHGNDNKEQILKEIDVLKNSTNDLQYGIDSISEKLPQTDDLTSRLDELYQNINNIVDAIQVAGLEDKEQILREVSDLKSFDGEIQDKLNFIAGSQLNQDFINARTEKINDAIQAFADNVQQHGNDNKEQILKEIDVLKNAVSDVQHEVGAAAEKIPQSALIIEQTEKLSGLINDFANNVSAKLEEINDSDKGYVTEAVKEAFGELQEQMAESINYLKGLTLNLDRSLAGSKNAILESVDMLKENAGKSIDAVNIAKDDIMSGMETISGNITEKLAQAEDTRNTFKNEIITQISNTSNENAENIKNSFESKLQDTFEKFNEKIAFLTGSIQTGAERNREQILETVDGLKNSALEIKSDVSSLLEKTRTEMQDALVREFASSRTDLEDKLNILSQDLTDKALGNKEQLLGNIADLKDVLTGMQENGQTVIERSGQFIKDEIEAKLQESAQNTLDKISELSDNLQNGSLADKEELIAKITRLGADFAEYKKLINDFNVNIGTIKNELSENLSNRLETFNKKTSDFIAEIKQLSSEKEGQILSELEEIKTLSNSVKADFNGLFIEKIDTLLENFKNITSANKSEILNSIETFKEELQNTNNEITTLTEKVTDNSAKVETFSNEVKQLLGSSFAEVTDILSSGKAEASEFQAGLKFEIKRSIDEITAKLFKYDEDSSSLREDLIFELQKTYNILSEKIEQQKDKAGNIDDELTKHFDEKFGEVNTQIQTGFAETQDSIVKNIAENLNFDELKTSVCNEILANTSEITSKFDSLASDIANNGELFTSASKINKNEILEQISLLKTDILNLNSNSSDTNAVIDEIKQIEEKIEGISDNILDALSNDLDESFTDNFKSITETIEDKISYVKDDIQEIVLKISEIDTIIEKVKDVVVVEFEDYFQNFDSKINTLSENVKQYFDNNIQKITALIEEYQQELNNLYSIDLSGYNEKTQLFVKEQIEEVKGKLEELKNNNTLDAATEDINSTIINSTEIIAKDIKAAKQSILNEVSNSGKVIEKIDNLQESLKGLDAKTQNVTTVIKDENASLKDVIARYQESIKALSNVDLSAYNDETKEFVKGELKQLKGQIIVNLASIFENISFIEEAEEIQNSICDSTDYIRDEINNLKNELIANSNSNDDVDAKFDNLKTILESITTGTSADSDKYVYTLPDVEMDIAKMRMAISDITDMLKQNKDEDNGVAERLDSIDDIRDDISSISKRTNKLIITSDDSNKQLKDNLAEFKRVINSVNSKFNSLNFEEFRRNLLDTKALVVSGLKSNKILNEAFMHFAEWIDDSASAMNSITTQVEDNKDSLKTVKHDLNELDNKIQEVKDTVSDVNAKFDKKLDVDYTKFLYDIECGLDKLNDKLEVQELKIKSLEKKLDNISNASSDNEEMNSVLEYIASQVSAANENSRNNKLLLQKVEKMEKQIKKFDESISKITAFVDGAN